MVQSVLVEEGIHIVLYSGSTEHRTVKSSEIDEQPEQSNRSNLPESFRRRNNFTVKCHFSIFYPKNLILPQKSKLKLEIGKNLFSSAHILFHWGKVIFYPFRIFSRKSGVLPLRNDPERVKLPEYRTAHLERTAPIQNSPNSPY